VLTVAEVYRGRGMARRALVCCKFYHGKTVNACAV
jgi:hypothetical protein